MTDLRRWILLASHAALTAVCAPLSANGQARPAVSATTVIRAARMIDPKSGNVMQNPVIVVQGGRIVSVASGAQVPADARVIDLGALSVMPGLIDAHTHLLQNYR
ncbi:MAG TPA: hypothetical protein VM076_08330, partial [Gemmatimonadaceae bacterium]|nr:hypothetical protein [Gemmatimonadaceae bacterium]